MARRESGSKLHQQSTRRPPFYPYTVRFEDREVVSRHRSFGRAIRSAERFRRKEGSSSTRYWVWDETRGRHASWQGWLGCGDESDVWYVGVPEFPTGHPRLRDRGRSE